MGERRVGIRELKATLSECVSEVKTGSTLVVTERGRPVARMVPEDPSVIERIKALSRAGILSWNGKRFSPRKPVAKLSGNRSMATIVSENRD